MQDTVQRPVYKRRWFIVVAACLVLVAVVLTVLPYGLSYTLNTWLRDNGGDEVTIHDVDFNVFTGRAAIENLRLRANQRDLMTIPRLELDVDWLPLFSRQVVLRSASINGVDLEIEQAPDGSLQVGGISLAGEETKEPVPAGKTWHVGVDSLAIVATSIRYRSPGLQLDSRLDDLRLRGIKTWVDQPAPLTIRGAINGAAISIDGELPPLSSGAGYRGRIDIDGLDLAVFAGLTGEAISELAGRLHVASQVDILQAQDKPLAVSQSGTLAVSDLAFRQPDAHVQLGRIGWDGKTGFTGGDALSVTATGGVKGTGVSLDVAGSQAVVGEIAWDGEINVAGGDVPVVTGTYSVTASQLDVDRQGSAARLVHVDAISADSVTMQEGGAIDIATIAAEGIALARTAADEGGAIVTLGGLALDSAQVAGGGIALGRLSARDLVADLRRDSAGQWRITQVMDSLQSADKPIASESGESDEAGGEGAEPAADKKDTAFSIDAISVTGKSAVTLADASVKPAFNTRMVVTRAEIGRIDSASPGANTPLTLEAKTDKHSRIDIKGTLQPFAARPTLKLDSQLEAIALINVSPYTIATLGYALKSGQLDADSTINIDQGKLDIGNKLTIRGLEVEAVDNTNREQLDQQMSVPLDTALNMLRDKNNTIKLDLPVSGDIDSPDFDISDAVNTAVGKALKKGSMTYLTMALQPYGALLTVAKMAGEAASKVRLDPVVFTPGGETLPATTHAYLEKVAGIIKNRPELNIKVCGLASEQDRQTLGGPVYASQTAGGRLPDTILDAPPASQPAAPDTTAPDSGSTPVPGSTGPATTGASGTAAPGVTDEQLQALADKRAAAVVDFLVTSHGVKASRLVACQPTIDTASDAQARVDLLI